MGKMVRKGKQIQAEKRYKEGENRHPNLILFEKENYMGIEISFNEAKNMKRRNYVESLNKCAYYPISKESITSDPRADAVSSLTILASNPQVLETRWEEKSSFSLLRLFLTGSTTITSIFSRTSRKLVIPEIFSSLYDTQTERVPR